MRLFLFCCITTLFTCTNSIQESVRVDANPALNDGGIGSDASKPCVAEATEFCDGIDNDCNGAIDDKLSRSCSNSCGDGGETCQDGTWRACDAPLQCACTPGTSEEVVCGDCGSKTRVCDAAGTWGAFAACGDPGHACTPSGSTRCSGTDAYQRCEAGPNACLVWSDALSCTQDEVCDLSSQCEIATRTDLFLIIGQSNAAGYGKGTATINSVAGAYEIDYAGGSNAFIPLTHPTGVGSGSEYQSVDHGFGLALANTWNSLRSESVYVFAAMRGSALVEIADNGTNGDWTDTVDNDGLYDFAVAAANNAKSAIVAQPDRRLGKVILIWLQGETDALHPSVHTPEYVAHLNALYQRFATALPFDAFLIASIGFTVDAPEINTDRFIEIMDAQELVANANGLATALVSRKALNLTRHCFADGLTSPECGLVDNYHYKTSVYEALGADIATNSWEFVVNGARALAPSAPPSTAMRCIGDNNTEKALIATYNSSCYRCPSVADLAYWTGQAANVGTTAAQNTIQSICDDFGYPGWNECMRQRQNGPIGQCPSGLDYLPVHSNRCFATCQF